MKTRILTWLLLFWSFSTLLMAQTNDKPPYSYKPEQVVTLPSGLKYVIIQKGTGIRPKSGDKITAHYHGMLDNGKVFDSSFDRNQPFDVKIGIGQVIRGWDEGFLLLEEGTKAVLIIPPSLGYGDQEVGGVVPANSTLTFHVQLLKVEPGPPPFKPYTYDLSKAVTLPSGLKYVIVEEGKGPKPNAGDMITAHYHGLLEDGKKFDSSFDRGEPFEVKIGMGQVIQGWDEGFQQFKEGTKAVLIIPPNLGYGERAQGSIPANSTLIFHVHLLKVKAMPPPFKPWPYDAAKAITTPSGLKYVIIKEGTGVVPQTGQTITANYHGTFLDGKKFDSSFDRGQPFSTQIGMGRVIKGWDEAFTTMKVGTQAVLIIPPDLAYGPGGRGGIPPNSTLVFYVELLDAK